MLEHHLQNMQLHCRSKVKVGVSGRCLEGRQTYLLELTASVAPRRAPLRRPRPPVRPYNCADTVLPDTLAQETEMKRDVALLNVIAD